MKKTIFILLLFLINVGKLTAQLKKEKKNNFPVTPYFQIGTHHRACASFTTFVDNYNKFYGLTGNQKLSHIGLNTNFGYGIKWKTESVFIKIGQTRSYANFSTGLLPNKYKYQVKFYDINSIVFEAGLYINKRILLGMGFAENIAVLQASRLYNDGTRSMEHFAYPLGTFKLETGGFTGTYYTGFALDKKRRFNLLLGAELSGGKDYMYTSFNAGLDNNVLVFPLNPDPSVSNTQQAIDGSTVRAKNKRFFIRLEVGF